MMGMLLEGEELCVMCLEETSSMVYSIMCMHFTVIQYNKSKKARKKVKIGICLFHTGGGGGGADAYSS